MRESQWLPEHNRVKIDKKDLSAMGSELKEAAKKIVGVASKRSNKLVNQNSWPYRAVEERSDRAENLELHINTDLGRKKSSPCVRNAGCQQMASIRRCRESDKRQHKISRCKSAMMRSDKDGKQPGCKSRATNESRAIAVAKIKTRSSVMPTTKGSSAIE
jgi:hypothetical protein